MFLNANGIVHYVRLDGQPGAPPLLMLHSLGTASPVWDAQVASLAGSFRVIRPDFRGHGLSGVTPGAPLTVQPHSILYTPADLGAWLCCAVRRLPISRSRTRWPNRASSGRT